MDLVAIKKSYVLWGQTETELGQRIDTLCQAVREQNGAVLQIESVPLPPQHGASAAIVYEVPLRRRLPGVHAERRRTVAGQ